MHKGMIISQKILDSLAWAIAGQKQVTDPKGSKVYSNEQYVKYFS